MAILELALFFITAPLVITLSFIGSIVLIVLWIILPRSLFHKVVRSIEAFNKKMKERNGNI